jgi:ABC-type nickel/cobalt efflux system permease component RcnA
VTSTAIARTHNAFRSIQILVASYLVVSIGTVVAAILMRDDPALVNTAVWIRGSIVVATSILMWFFVRGAARGSSKAYLRLRIASAVMVVAIAVILTVPGPFPLWMKLEQAVCGVVLLVVVILVNQKSVRASFRRE